MQNTKDEQITLSQLESTIRNFNNLTANTATVQNMLLRLETVYLSSDEMNNLQERNETNKIAENMLMLLDVLDLISDYK